MSSRLPSGSEATFQSTAEASAATVDKSTIEPLRVLPGAVICPHRLKVQLSIAVFARKPNVPINVNVQPEKLTSASLVTVNVPGDTVPSDVTETFVQSTREEACLISIVLKEEMTFFVLAMVMAAFESLKSTAFVAEPRRRRPC